MFYIQYIYYYLRTTSIEYLDSFPLMNTYNECILWEKGGFRRGRIFLKKVLHIALLFSVLLCLKNKNNLSPKFKLSGAI